MGFDAVKYGAVFGALFEEDRVAELGPGCANASARLRLETMRLENAFAELIAAG